MRSLILFLLCTMSFSSAFCIATVSGSISNFRDQHIDFAWYFFSSEMGAHSTKVEDGQFSTEVPIKTPTFLWLQVGETWIELYLEPNDNLTIKGDYSNLPETIQFSGKGSASNNYLADYTKSVDEMGAEFQRSNDLSPQEYMSRSNAFLDYQISELEELAKEHSLDPSFKTLVSSELMYREKIAQFRYFSDRYPGSELFEKVDLDVLKDYRALLNLSENLPLTAGACRHFLSLQTMNLLRLKTYKDEISSTESDSLFRPHRAYVLAKNHHPKNNAEFIGANLLYNYMTEGTFNEAQDFYKEFTASCTNDHYKTILSTKYEALRQHFDNPVITPNMHVLSSQNENGEDATFEELIAPFKGKVIYIDVWASWCAPCRYEMKNSVDIKKALSAEGVVFMYLSVDESEKNWMTALSSLQVEGEHYLLSTGQDATICDDMFNVKGIPYYIIVDREGNVVQTNARRPSDPLLIDDLEVLLAK